MNAAFKRSRKILANLESFPEPQSRRFRAILFDTITLAYCVVEYMFAKTDADT